MNRRNFILSFAATGACMHRPSTPPTPQRVVFSPGYQVSFFGLERLHPFDIRKLTRIAKSVQDMGVELEEPTDLGESALASVHDPAYLASLHQAKHLSTAMEATIPGVLSWAIEDKILRPFRHASSGTAIAAQRAIENQDLAVNLGGGFHHARPRFGHGFCIYNDVALAIHRLRSQGFRDQILIFDTDAHQGDGNHAFFRHDHSVHSISLHQQSAFPHPKLTGDEDVGLADHIQDDAYLSKVSQTLERWLKTPPSLLIHVAGSDILHDDPLTTMQISPEGLLRRDALVLQAARSAGVPVLYLLAGGYGPSAASAQGASVRSMLTS